MVEKCISESLKYTVLIVFSRENKKRDDLKNPLSLLLDVKMIVTVSLKEIFHHNFFVANFFVTTKILIKT